MPIAQHRDSWAISVFVARLRAAELSIGPAEYEQILFTLTELENWPLDLLKAVLLSLLANSDAETFDVIFSETFIHDPAQPFLPLSQQRAQLRAAVVPGSAVSTKAETAVPLPNEPLAYTSPVAEKPKVSAWTRILALLTDPLGLTLLVLLGSGLVGALLMFGSAGPGFVSPPEHEPGQLLDASIVPPLAYMLALLAAGGILAPSLFVLRWVTLREPGQLETENRATDAQRFKGPDRSSFRFGLVGGKPPSRISRTRLQSIVDAVGYADGGEDRRSLDVDATIKAVIDAAGVGALRHPTRSVLPNVLILEDVTSPARHWNSCSTEVAAALGQRGIDVETRPFPGSLHGPGDHPRRTALAREVADLVGGWEHVLVMVFSDGNRWRQPDTDFLASLGEHCMAFWFDDRDRELWDHRLDPIRTARVKVHEATGDDIEAALRQAYATTRRSAEQPANSGAALRRRSANTLADEVGALLGDAIGWAAHCALFEPISAALAENLRQAFNPAVRWSAFSRLVALPGSTLGPEGLRFGAEVRTLLLGRFANLEAESRRDAVVAFIIENIRKDSKDLARGSVGDALARYAEQRTEVFRDLDGAVSEIVTIRATNLLDDEAVEDFLKRLQPLAVGAAPTRVWHPEQIPLPGRVRRTETLRLLQHLEAVTPSLEPEVWRLSPPELRVATNYPPQSGLGAVFLSANELLLFAQSGELAGGDPATILSIPSGASRIAGLDMGIPEACEAANGVVAWAVGGRFFAAFPQPERPFSVRESSQSGEALSTGIVHVASDGSEAIHVAVQGNGATLRRLRPNGDTRSVMFDVSGDVTAVAELPDEGQLLIGTDGGSLLLVDPDTGSSSALAASDGRVFRAAGMICALAAARDPDSNRIIVACASDDGHNSLLAALVLVPDRSGLSKGGGGQREFEVRSAGRAVELRSRARHLEMSADGGTVLVAMEGTVDLIDQPTGLSLVAGDADFLLSSLGEAGDRGATVIAASLAARRVAVLTGGSGRLEVRRLMQDRPSRDADETAAEAEQITSTGSDQQPPASEAVRR